MAVRQIDEVECGKGFPCSRFQRIVDAPPEHHLVCDAAGIELVVGVLHHEVLRRRRFLGESAAPSLVTRPCCSQAAPTRTFASVVFPVPFAPHTTVTHPRGNSASTWRMPRLVDG